mmetsp:Transcript_11306/g.17218  ORF Transcript_11306/g.17218 Transcript_11306/m.17218 type:complete len:351 (-) Transcript_11306:43-1095(-)
MLFFSSLLLLLSSALAGWSVVPLSECTECLQSGYCERTKSSCLQYTPDPSHTRITPSEFTKQIPPGSVIVFYGDSVIRGLFIAALEYFGQGDWCNQTHHAITHAILASGKPLPRERALMDHTYLCPPPIVEHKNLTLAFMWNPLLHIPHFFTKRPWATNCTHRCPSTVNISNCDGSHRPTVDLRWRCGNALDSLQMNSSNKRQFIIVSGTGVHSIIHQFSSFKVRHNMSDQGTYEATERKIYEWVKHFSSWAECQGNLRAHNAVEILVPTLELQKLGWVKSRVFEYNTISEIVLRAMKEDTYLSKVVFHEYFNATPYIDYLASVDGIHYNSVFNRLVVEKILGDALMAFK